MDGSGYGTGRKNAQFRHQDQCPCDTTGIETVTSCRPVAHVGSGYLKPFLSQGASGGLYTPQIPKRLVEFRSHFLVIFRARRSLGALDFTRSGEMLTCGEGKSSRLLQMRKKAGWSLVIPRDLHITEELRLHLKAVLGFKAKPNGGASSEHRRPRLISLFT